MVRTGTVMVSGSTGNPSRCSLTGIVHYRTYTTVPVRTVRYLHCAGMSQADRRLRIRSEATAAELEYGTGTSKN